jgi:Domain of unknown function (DUF4214)
MGNTMATVLRSSIFASSPSGSSLPDSVTYGGGSIWVEYGNGADPAGASGSSTIVQYSLAGAVQNTYTLSGHVDGLKYDPATNLVWGLHNEDGNTSVSLINANTGLVSAPLNYASPDVTGPTSVRGIDDIVFVGSKVYVSETNPAKSGDPIINLVDNGPAPFGPLTFTPILAFGASGTNVLTGQTTVLPINDPDSLKVLANGGLMLTGGDDGSLIFINNPGTPQQTQSYIVIPGTTAGSAGLDDAIIPQTASGTLYISDQNNNAVDKVAVTGLTPDDILVAIGSLNEVADVNIKTGATTALVTNVNSPHGLVFIGSDGTVANNAPAGLSSTGDTDTGEVARLYQTSFNRAADLPGLQFWKGLLDTNTATFGQVVAGFVSGAEFQADSGSLTNLQFVDQQYHNALGRTADSGGESFWTQQLTAGTMSRADVVGAFVNSQEAQAVLAPAAASAHSMLG